MKFELTKEESDIVLNSLPEKKYLSEIQYVILKNKTGELLAKEVDFFKLKINKGGYRYVYEHNSDEWKPIFNIVKIKIREEKLKVLGI